MTELAKKRHSSFKDGITLGGVATIANLHLTNAGAGHLKADKEFVEDLLTACEDHVIKSGNRLRMPFNLGYMQVLKHDFNTSDIKLEIHNKFYGDDFSVVWVLHPMFKNIILTHTYRLKKRLLEFIEKTRKKNYLTELPNGDYFFIKNNDHAHRTGVDRLCEREESRATSFPKKTEYLQYARFARDLYLRKSV